MSYLSSDRSFSDIQNRFVFLFLQKASKKQVICYSIAVKNACLCWVIKCIAPSTHALTALLMWGVSFVFSSPHFQLFPACYTHHYVQALVVRETCDQSEQFPDSCIYETTIISLYNSIYSNIMYGIGYYWCPSVWEILYKLKIPDTNVHLFCSHDKLVTSSKALEFLPHLRQTLFSSTVQRSVPNKNDNQCPKLTNQPPVTKQKQEL